MMMTKYYLLTFFSFFSYVKKKKVGRGKCQLCIQYEAYSKICDVSKILSPSKKTPQTSAVRHTNTVVIIFDQN